MYGFRSVVVRFYRYGRGRSIFVVQENSVYVADDPLQCRTVHDRHIGSIVRECALNAAPAYGSGSLRGVVVVIRRNFPLIGSHRSGQHYLQDFPRRIQINHVTLATMFSRRTSREPV